jgi:O-antigen ligase
METLPIKLHVTKRNIYLACFIMLAIAIGVASNFIPFVAILAAIFALVGIGLFFYHPYLGVLAYLFFEYASMAAQFPALRALALGKVIALSTFAVWFFTSYVAGNLRFVIHKINWLMLIWLLVAVMSALTAPDHSRVYSGTFDFAKWVLIYFMIINIVDSKTKWQWFVAILLLLNFKMSQFQIRAYSAGIDSASNASHFIREGLGAGSTAYFGNAGDFGVAMCVVTPLAFYAFLAAKNKIIKYFSLTMVIFFMFSIIKSGARGNMLGLVAIAIVYAVKSSKKFLVGALIIISLVIYWVTAPPIVRARFLAATSEQKDHTSAHRLELWQGGLKLLLEYPLLGVGATNFGIVYANKFYGGEGSQRWVPHNIFIQNASELGFSGMICLIALIYLYFKTNKHTREIVRDAPAGNDMYYHFAHALDLSLIGYLVSGSFLAVLYYPHLYILMAMTVSLNHIASKTLTNRDNQPITERSTKINPNTDNYIHE